MAEEDEFGVSLTGAIVFPSFRPTDATEFDLVAAAGGLGLTYGVHDNLWLDLRTTFTAYRGQNNQTLFFRDQPLTGTLFFSSRQVHANAGVRLNLYPGHRLSPYLSARGGFIFSTFRNQRLINDSGLEFPIGLEDFSEIQWTASGSFVLEYRFLEFLLFAVEPGFTKAFGDGRNNYFSTLMVNITFLLNDI